MKKIIFLDIDGVLNSARYDRQRGEKDGNIDESRLALLSELVKETSAEIVLSSTWRKHWDNDDSASDDTGKELNRVFEKYGLKISDKTPVFKKDDRPKEIREWIKEHFEEIERFVIIDDTFGGFEELEPNLVKTDFGIGRGLEIRHIEKAKEILNQKHRH